MACLQDVSWSPENPIPSETHGASRSRREVGMRGVSAEGPPRPREPPQAVRSLQAASQQGKLLLCVDPREGVRLSTNWG